MVIADGLSAAAVQAQVPALLPLLAIEAEHRSWQFGQPFFVRHGRVGILNDIGEFLNPAVAVLLIGERPGLTTALSLSAYMAYRPRHGHDDARRNLISNIHARGVSPDQAAYRIAQLAAQMIQLATSGVQIKEDGSAVPDLIESWPTRLNTVNRCSQRNMLGPAYAKLFTGGPDRDKFAVRPVSGSNSVIKCTAAKRQSLRLRIAYSMISEPLLKTTDLGLYCQRGDFFVDPWRPVDRAVVTHAHADHLYRDAAPTSSHAMD